MVTALKASHSDTKRYHDEMITALQKQYQTLQHRLDAMYVDKLDGTISQVFFDQKSSKWRCEQADILRKVEQHQRANQTYVDEGVRLLELAQRATTLYERQEMRKKRRLLDFVFSNSIWQDGRLIPTYRKPFDMLAVTFGGVSGQGDTSATSALTLSRSTTRADGLGRSVILSLHH